MSINKRVFERYQFGKTVYYFLFLGIGERCYIYPEESVKRILDTDELPDGDIEVPNNFEYPNT